MKGEASSFEPDRAALERAFAGATAAEIVYAAQQYMRLGALLSVLALCDAARARGLADPGLLLTEATARFGAGERARALGVLDELLAAAPDHLGALALKAHMVAALGNAPLARALATRVVDAHTDYPGVLPLLSQIAFPGPQYRDVLARLHRLLAPDTYLEIGVDTGATLSLATTASIAVGVDPNAPAQGRAPQGNARLYAQKSDAFFANETPATVFGGRPVDLTFVDGMHWFEFALRDFANAERWSSPSSTILLHDCLPVSPRAARRERDSSFWVGDVWKVLEILLDYRPGLRVFVVPTAPSGLVVVRGLDPESTTLFAKYEEIVARYRELPYPSSDGSWPARYHVVPNSDDGLKQAISA
ncbi:MAG TPA: class I SAM-dependent methyltransferase [Polyangiaceae bacterium]|nr:class I SAM-dependent methyltransferase [Polyangiaceae bacterium]